MQESFEKIQEKRFLFQRFVMSIVRLQEAAINYWGGGPVLFQMRGPKNFSPSQVNSPKILPPPKMCAQKIVTLPCNKILSIQMFHRENPYKRNFESIFSLE